MPKIYKSTTKMMAVIFPPNLPKLKKKNSPSNGG